MRMWMCDARILCQQHLLGEHVECHMFIGTLQKGISVDGYIERNLLEPRSLLSRHEELAEEMERRGMNHQSPVPDKISISNGWWVQHTINRAQSFDELMSRCLECRTRAKEAGYVC